MRAVLPALGWGWWPGQRPAAEIGMLGEHACDRDVGARVVACEGREKDVLLDSEVVASFGIPEGEERFTCGYGGRVGGAIESLGYNEAVVMVSRKVSKGVAPFHWHIVVVTNDVTLLTAVGSPLGRDRRCRFRSPRGRDRGERSVRAWRWGRAGREGRA